MAAAASALAFFALAAAPSAGAAAGTHRADGRLGDWRGHALTISGQTTISHGELVYSDWVYDDYGPNLDGISNNSPAREMSSLNPTAGDYRYPDPARYAYNGADLRELRVAYDRTGLHVLFALETLKAPDAAIATLAIDGDRSAATSRAEWPDGIHLDTKGPERFVTTWGSGARITTPSGSAPLHTAVNLAENTIEVDVPRSALGDVGPRVRLWAVTGVNDGSGHYTRPPVVGPLPAGAVGTRTGVYNAAFRRHEPLTELGSAWNENVQAAALAKRDVSTFHQDVDLRELRRGVTRARPVLKPGFYVKVFRSRYDLGEGIQQVPNNGVNGEPETLSRWQPYGLYIPKGYGRGRRSPMTVYIHSGFGNHTSFPRIGLNLFKQIGDDRHAVIVEPLNRGGSTGALDAGLADIIEAMNDAQRSLAVDGRRTTVLGQSEGGYGAYRLGLLMPDRFARAAVIDGLIYGLYWPYPGPAVTPATWETIGNTNLIVPNARNVPFQITHVVPDVVVPLTTAQHQVASFRDNDNLHRFITYAGGDHFSSLQLDEWSREREWLGDARAPRNPRRVVLKRYPAMDLPHFGLRFDTHAYWLSGVEARRHSARSDYALVRAKTWGRGGRQVLPETYGPDAIATPRRGPGEVTGLRWRSSTPIPRRNRLDVRLTNTARATFALRRMGLSPKRCLTAQTTSDGPARLRLLGRFPRRLRANHRVRRARRGLSFAVRDGTAAVRVCPRRR